MSNHAEGIAADGESFWQLVAAGFAPYCNRTCRMKSKTRLEKRKQSQSGAGASCGMVGSAHSARSPLGTILSKRLSIDFVAAVGKFVQENNL
jgi:hypothetical protein